jgi:predicted  nucleic acid-binding Zn-ribbon protein
MLGKILAFINPKKKELKMMSDKIEAHKAASLRAMEALKAARKALIDLQATCTDHSAEIDALRAQVAAAKAQKDIDDQAIEALTFAWDAILGDNGGSMGGVTE